MQQISYTHITTASEVVMHLSMYYSSIYRDQLCFWVISNWIPNFNTRKVTQPLFNSLVYAMNRYLPISQRVVYSMMLIKQRPKLQSYIYGSLLMERYGLLIVRARLELSTVCIVQSQFESAGNPFHNLTLKICCEFIGLLFHLPLSLLFFSSTIL